MQPNNTSRSLSASTVTMLALFGIASAHIKLANPKPWGGDQLTTSPLASTGSNYPCQQSSDTATFYDSTGITNTLTIGGKETVSFSGSASHGGGSCQLALTTDVPPTASSSWQVMLSIMGGCPSTGAEGTDNYTYTVPTTFSPGDYSFAWTWISKESGAPEYYMNCAPVTLVSGSSSKRSAATEEVDTLLARDTLPQLFVADLSSINSCQKPNQNVDVVFPDPGTQVQTPALSPSYYTFTQSTCTPQVAAAAAGGTAAASKSAAQGTTTTAAGAGAAKTTTPGTSASQATTGFVTSAKSTPGGIFVTTPTLAATSSAAIATTNATIATSAAIATSTAVSTGSAQTLTGLCTNEGVFMCNGKQYQQCASGSWSVMQDLPAGTTCETGESTTLWARNDSLDRLRRGSRRVIN